MRSFFHKIHPKQSPIIFTIFWLFAALVISEVLSGLLEKREYSLIISGLLTVAVAFLFKMPKSFYLTTSFRLDSLKYFVVPIGYIISIPLFTGGYHFEFITNDILLMMTGVGIFEEVLTHSICMGLLIHKWGIGRHSIIKAGIVSSLLFGSFHLLAILQDPTNEHLVLMKMSTVVFASFIGIGFAGLVHVSNTIWPAVVLHALIDIMFYVGSEEMLAKIYNEWTLTFSIISILYALPFGLFGIWLLQKK